MATCAIIRYHLERHGDESRFKTRFQTRLLNAREVRFADVSLDHPVTLPSGYINFGKFGKRLCSRHEGESAFRGNVPDAIASLRAQPE